MAKHYETVKNSPILFNMQKNGYTKQDIAKAMNVTRNTLDTYIQRPLLMQGEKIAFLAGLFGIPAERFFYELLRNKPQARTKEAVFFLDSIREGI